MTFYDITSWRACISQAKIEKMATPCKLTYDKHWNLLRNLPTFSCQSMACSWKQCHRHPAKFFIPSSQLLSCMYLSTFHSYNWESLFIWACESQPTSSIICVTCICLFFLFSVFSRAQTGSASASRLVSLVSYLSITLQSPTILLMKTQPLLSPGLVPEQEE